VDFGFHRKMGHFSNTDNDADGFAWRNPKGIMKNDRAIAPMIGCPSLQVFGLRDIQA